MTPHQAPAATADHPWPIQNQWPTESQWPAQTQRVQQGYADEFDGAQSYGGYQDAYRDYPAQSQVTYQDAYPDYPAQSQVTYQDYPEQGQTAYQDYPGHGGYQDYPAFPQQSGYQTPGNGYAQLPDGFDNVVHDYRDPRSSGPMPSYGSPQTPLSAPDEAAWSDFSGGRDGGSGGGRRGRTGGAGRGVIASAVMGFLAAGAAIGIATLAAAFFRPQASPIIAVGEAFIDRTPPALKNFAVQKFGENDKNMLLLGMYVTIALLAMGIGVLAKRRVEIGVVGVALFGLFGAYVAYTRPASQFSDIIPSIIGGIAGVAALLWLSNAATPEPVPVRPVNRRGYQWADGGIA